MLSDNIDVVVFGNTKISSISWFWLTQDNPERVVAFTVDEAYQECSEFHGLPVVFFEMLTDLFPPHRTALHIPIGWKFMNELRAKKLRQAEEWGYQTVSFISPKANLASDFVPSAHCQIHPSVTVGPFTKIGKNTFIFQSSSIGHHVVIENDCYIAANVTVLAGTKVGHGTVLGASSTILTGVEIAPHCFIGAGSLVTKDTEENSVYMGSPARKLDIPADQFHAAL